MIFKPARLEKKFPFWEFKKVFFLKSHFHWRNESIQATCWILGKRFGGELNKEDKERIRKQRELFKKAGKTIE